MPTIIRQLAGALLVGFAIYAMAQGLPLDIVVVSLLFAFMFISYPKWLRAKFGDIEFEARFGHEDDNTMLDSGQDDSLERLSDQVDEVSQGESDSGAGSGGASRLR